MQHSRAWAFMSYAALWSSAVLICCGTDEGLGPSNTPKGDLIGGERNSNEAGQGAGGSSGGSAPSAGTSGSLTLGGSAGSESSGGTAGDDGKAGGAGHGSAGESGSGQGGAESSDERLELCARLTQASGRATTVTTTFAKTAYADCDVYWIQRLPVDDNHYADFLNSLSTWTYDFWGCSEKSVSTFGIVYGTPAISAGDAARLIDIYVQTVDADVQLSDNEERDMRAALQRLSKLVIEDESLEPSRPDSNPKCQSSGGAGGAGPGAGAGGAP